MIEAKKFSQNYDYLNFILVAIMAYPFCCPTVRKYLLWVIIREFRLNGQMIGKERFLETPFSEPI